MSAKDLGQKRGLSKVFKAITAPIRWLLISLLGILVLFGVSTLTMGIFVGIMAVLAMWLTIESIPGVRYVSTTNVGLVVMSVATAFLVHAVIGTSTIVGMIGASTALVVKYFLLVAEADRVHNPRTDNGLRVITVNA